MDKIYLDKQTCKILAYIARKGDAGRPWGALIRKFGEDAVSPPVLEQMQREDYIISRHIRTKPLEVAWLSLEDFHNEHLETENLAAVALHKARYYIEQRRGAFWKWFLPTALSVAALLISLKATLLP